MCTVLGAHNNAGKRRRTDSINVATDWREPGEMRMQFRAMLPLTTGLYFCR